jgi:diphosphomevalonate decarboxylase
MQRSVETSDLLNYRVTKCVPRRMLDIKKAIEEKDFQSFAEITMKDSNQFHAVCLDTYPTCVYMNDVSHSISALVHRINKNAGRNLVSPSIHLIFDSYFIIQ